jgi:hypothetical protein
MCIGENSEAMNNFSWLGKVCAKCLTVLEVDRHGEPVRDITSLQLYQMLVKVNNYLPPVVQCLW